MKNGIFKKAQTTPTTPGTATSPVVPASPAPRTPAPSMPATPAPPAQLDGRGNPIQNATNDTQESRDQRLLKLATDAGLAEEATKLQYNIKQYQSQKDQDNNLFETSKGNCLVYQFSPQTLRGTPCDFITNISSSLNQSSSLQEVEQYYQKYISTMTQLMSVYNKYVSLFDQIKTKLLQSRGGQNYNSNNTSDEAFLDQLKVDFQKNITSLKTEQMNAIRANQPLLDTSVRGRSILDCYEEIIDTMEYLCEKVYQPLQKSFATMGLGPVAVYARQMITGYQDIIRIYTQELAPIYQQIAAQSQQNIDQKRVQYTINLLSKIIPESYRIQIIAIESGLFEVTTQNKADKLKAALGGH
jgi:hypothetical protein